MVRATNWLGDAVMSLPAIRAIRGAFARSEISVVARPWVADLYGREKSIDRVIPYTAQKGLRAKREFAAGLRKEGFDLAILLQNAFDAALMAWMAGIPERIGYNRDGRRILLTRAIPVPESGEIPRHERFYYLELLRRAEILERYPESEEIRLERGTGRASGSAILGISPGAAYGTAKQWLPERFVEAARILAPSFGSVLVFGSAGEKALCDQVADGISACGLPARNLAGATTLQQFIDMAGECRLFLTNDSGAMHIASALGVPTVAIFGATDDTTTGPTGPLAYVVREHAECSPCLLRECPIDHRCMTRVSADAVAGAAQRLLHAACTADDAARSSAPLLKESESAWTPESKF